MVSLLLHFFQYTSFSLKPFNILTLSIINSLVTSVILEVIILTKKGMKFKNVLQTALNMSFIYMISMEVEMNTTDYFSTGGAKVAWLIIAIMLLVGFLTSWPYNYWCLKKFGKACCY